MAALEQAGVAAVYTPQDFDITRIMREIVALLDAAPSAALFHGLRRLSANGLGVSADGAALGARLRERDLSAAPAALNLLESTAVGRPRKTAALLSEVSPAALGRERRPRDRRDRTAGAGKSTLLSALLAVAERAPTVAMLAVDPSSRRSGARCSATAPASSSTRPTAAC